MKKKTEKVFELDYTNKKCKEKRFEIKRKLKEEETGELFKEVIECPYCHVAAIYEIPAAYTIKDIVIKGIPE